jgi:hypothetical protein
MSLVARVIAPSAFRTSYWRWMLAPAKNQEVDMVISGFLALDTPLKSNIMQTYQSQESRRRTQDYYE